MSIHPSLNTPEKDKKQRSVLKRTERLKAMEEKEEWKEGDDVYGLPKLKTVRIKIKKEKVAEKPEDAEAAVAAEGAAGGAEEVKEKGAVKGKGAAEKGAAAKGAAEKGAAGKGPAAKGQDKKK
ncbi:small basic protein [Candidatus Omnitrophota bacterium]